MRVINYEVHNVLRVRDVRLDLDGRNLFLVGGRNAQGKSSALSALLMALCGRSGMESYPEVALTEGKDEGFVKVELTGDSELHEDEKLTVELKLKRKRNGSIVEEFRILDSAGDEAPEPRTLLKKLYDLKGFDPLAFDRATKKERREIILKLLGLDFTKQDKVRKALYDERTGVGNDGKRLKAQADSLPEFDGVPDELLSVDSLMEEVERRSRVNRENEKARSELKTRQSLVEAAERQEKDLAEKIRKLQAELDHIADSREDAVSRLRDQEGIVAGLVDQDVDSVKQQIKDAAKVNEQVSANRKKRQLIAQVDELRTKYESLTGQIDEIDESKTKAIAAAKFPVDGMGFDEEGVLLNGLPFEQASQKERIMASIDVGIALNPKLKLFVCQDGSALDNDAIAALDEKLKQTGYQMVAEVVTRTGADEDLCAVVIRDGKVVKAQPELAA